MIQTAPHPSAEIVRPFDIRIASSELAVRDALAGVLRALGPLDLDIEELGTVELVLAEALNNIVEHAYDHIGTCGPIFIHGTHEPDGLHFRIKDRGKAMPNGQIPLGMSKNIEVAVDDMPEGGFGWFMIRDLAKDVKYRRIGQENQLDLRLAVAIGYLN
tara:strand:+ start:1090 stop:1566 length:477 start_codon:yes stop_codon:yes gene_type:complete